MRVRSPGNGCTVPDMTHSGGIAIDVVMVGQLVAAQCPQWAHLPVEPVASTGTDNALFRLGDDLLVRLPRVPWAVAQVAKEQRWLPWLAPRLPLAIPEPLAHGAPGAGYPWPWSIYRWLDGTATTPRLDDRRMASDLAAFLSVLHRLDPRDGPAAGAHNFFRGVPLAQRDALTRAAIASLVPTIDADAATAAWATALRAPPWPGPPVWIHGDLQPANLLTTDGGLCAVIDFGGLGVGDPACDLLAAWNLLTTDARTVFRDALAVDEATWTRGRGWALSTAVIALDHYQHSNPALAALSRRTINAVLTS